jgi:hypothetical protein
MLMPGMEEERIREEDCPCCVKNWQRILSASKPYTEKLQTDLRIRRIR